MIIINGQTASTIPIHDRGLQYGDGLFETLEIVNGQPVFWQCHWQRLLRGCSALALPPPDAAQLRKEIQSCSSGQLRAVLKLIYTRGSGERGYRLPNPCQPTRILSVHPFPDYPSAYAQNGVTLHVCATRLSHQPRLAGIKHLNRLEQILARAEWQDDNIPEGLLCDEYGNVTECVMSNLFFIRDGQVFTPALDQCGVAGIVRELVMDYCAAQGIPMQIGHFTLETLWQADEVFITNSLIGLWPVTCIATHTWPVGAITRRIAENLAACRQRAIANAE